MAGERLLFPFGVYDTNRCAMVWIGLYENEDDVWQIYLCWPSREEIEDAKKRGFAVLPLTVNYQPPKMDHAPVRLVKHDDKLGHGSFEVRYNDGRPSMFFYWDEGVDQDVALDKAKTFAREERDKLQPKETAAGDGAVASSR